MKLLYAHLNWATWRQTMLIGTDKAIDEYHAQQRILTDTYHKTEEDYAEEELQNDPDYIEYLKNQ